DGHDLGAPVLLDGGFTAWRLPPTAGGSTLTITWTPQRVVDIALLASLAGLLAVAACIAFGARRRGANQAAARAVETAPRLSWPWQPRAAPSLVLSGIAILAAMAFAGPTVAIVVVPVL